MCGITGIWHLNNRPVAQQAIERFNNSLAHRGPDGYGIYKDDDFGIALGHRRLSILDLSEAGKQPMTSASGRYIITYNGEVYNFLELQNELEKLGHKFKTRTDTEVILAAWEQWGKDCWQKFNGMWAIALWDTEKKTLLVCKDRFGIKPLYYLYIPGKMFAFASETIAFKNLEGYERIIDNRNLAYCLKDLSYLEAVGETIFSGVKKVGAGHYMTISADGNCKEEKWWSTDQNLTDVPKKYEDQVARFGELLQDACRIRLRSDVPIATALSGGLDSSSVYCTVNQLRKNSTQLSRLPADWQKAVVATFPGTEMDEKAYAAEVVKFTNGSAIYVAPEETNIADSIIDEVKREDFIYQSPPVVHNIYRMMKEKGISVSLDGHGVDEMIYGYSFDIKQAFYVAGALEQKRDLLKTYAGLTGRPYKDIEKALLPRSRFQKLTPDRIYNKLQEKFGRPRKDDQQWIHDNSTVPSAYYEHDGTESQDGLYRIPFRAFHVNSLPALLRNWDIAAMRHGVEIRMPFMDWRLVTYVFSLPFESKTGNGFSKKILRDSMKGIMPDSVRLRTHKIGVNAPMQEWFAGPLKSFILDAVNSSSFLQSEIWNGPLIRDFVMKRQNLKRWETADCVKIWSYLNAWLIMTAQS